MAAPCSAEEGLSPKVRGRRAAGSGACPARSDGASVAHLRPRPTLGRTRIQWSRRARAPIVFRCELAGRCDLSVSPGSGGGGPAGLVTAATRPPRAGHSISPIGIRPARAAAAIGAPAEVSGASEAAGVTGRRHLPSAALYWESTRMFREGRRHQTRRPQPGYQPAQHVSRPTQGPDRRLMGHQLLQLPYAQLAGALHLD